MREQYQIIVIDSSELINIAKKLRNENARLVQICAVSIDTGYELTYSFAKGYEFINYRIIAGFETVIQSISEIFPSASLYEDEMSELFGVKIKGIELDYKDKLYRIEAKTPFKN